jgi:hypothetical protein
MWLSNPDGIGAGWRHILGLSLNYATLACLAFKRFHSMRQHGQYHLKALAYRLGASQQVDN